MTSSGPVVHSTLTRQKRVLRWVALGLSLYVLSAGPVTRLAPEFADWFYAPLGVVSEIPLAGSLLRGWLSVWGVDVT